MLKIKNLTKSYKNFSVLRGLEMNVDRGSVYGFVGKNGCGKTTTMNIIANQIRKDSGEIKINDGNPYKIGYLPETPSLYGYMTAREYLTYISECGKLQNKGGEIIDTKKRVDEILEIVQLTSAANRRSKGFSRGMTQRLGIGAVILNNPDLLILDEPTSALDPEGRADVSKIIAGLKKSGMTIILCTHILSDVEKHADRIGVMSGGIIVCEGTVRQIVTEFGGAKGVIVRLSEKDIPHYSEIRKLSVVGGANYLSGDKPMSDSFDSSGAVYFTVNQETKDTQEDKAELCKAIMKYLYENEVVPERVEIASSTLEEAYFGVLGGRK